MVQIGVGMETEQFAFDVNARFSYDSEDGIEIRAEGSFNLTLPSVNFGLKAAFFLPRKTDDEGVDMKVKNLGRRVLPYPRHHSVCHNPKYGFLMRGYFSK